MALNKSKGQMYPWVTHTWNPIRGCAHDCSYCYLRAMGYDMTPRLVDKELKRHLVKGKTIFVGSTCDMFGAWVPKEWIEKVLARCNEFENTYFFQSECPTRFFEFLVSGSWPRKIILGTTIETNRGPVG